MNYKPFRKNSHAALFLELAKLDEEGFSRVVPVTEFASGTRYSVLALGNGGSWCRVDGPLGKRFNIDRKKEGGIIVSVSLQGRNKKPIGRSIPVSIKKEIDLRRCVVLDISKTECDHKDGRLDDPRLNDPKKVDLNDFQPLSKGANNAKRQHCKTCRETGMRFDATKLGYSVKQYKGTKDYQGSCIGCYWYDPIAFNRETSKNFKDKT